MAAQPLVLFFKNTDKRDLALVGGKGANLGEMTGAGFPVPNGFSVTVPSYELFLKENAIEASINEILKGLDVSNASELNEAAKKIQKIILTAEIPEDVSREVTKAYKKLSGIFKKALVAVRSSATAEDLPGMSFAGQQATFLNVKGDNSLIQKVRECWASLFTPRAIFYRTENKIPHEKVKICVIVQKMVQSEVSGVMFSIDPVTNDKEKIIIEAVWGLGEMIVQGSVIPDRYVVQKDTFAILSKEISDQAVQLIKIGNDTREIEVPKRLRDKQKITNEEIVKLAKISDKLQKHYYFPQDSEWAKEKKELYITQTRPVTTIDKKPIRQNEEKTDVKISETPILSGNPASPGIGVGPVKILKSPKEIGKITPGDVLVAPMTSPDYVPAMKKAVAIITEQGGQTSHAAIVSRELGIPCVVGAEGAIKILSDGSVVSVDGKTGKIYAGASIKKELMKDEQKEKIYTSKTATKVFVNLAEPERAVEVSKMNVDGVGLLRAEFMIAAIGVHPKEAIQKKEQDKFIKKLEEKLTTFCKAFYPRPIVYRATDFKTNEYRALPGGAKWEPVEPNPMLGYRGAFRYVNDPEVFNLELQAIKNVRQKYNNLNLMIPFVRSPEELAKVRRLVTAEGLFESTSFKFWMMVEIPVNVIMLDDFIDVGIDGVSIGSNDLTMLIQGTDRDNSDVASVYNERSPAVYWALKHIIKTCNKRGIASSICGQAPSSYEDLVEKLVEYGITDVSVNPDAVNRVRGVIMRKEREIISERK